MIYQELSKNDFRDAFERMDRKNQFSYEGLGVIYDYLDESDGDTELDVIAICCDFTEYENFEELQNNYGVEDMEELKNNTLVLHIDDERFIIQNY